MAGLLPTQFRFAETPFASNLLPTFATTEFLIASGPNASDRIQALIISGTPSQSREKANWIVYSRDYKGILAGAALALIGIFTASYSIVLLDLGTVASMGPGMFPAALGVILSALGIVIFLSAFFRSGDFVMIDVRSAITVLISVVAFALTIRPFGFIPAICASTLIASRADSKLSWSAVAILAGGLSAGAFLIFRVGLGMPIAALGWQW